MRLVLSLVFFTWSAFLGAQTLSIPALTSPVMDLAGFMTPQQRAELSELAYEIYANKGPQITILTVPDLQEYPIEEFSIRVAEKWQLGLKEKGNGLLIIASRAERKIRIEVGEGIEGEITDFESNQYINQIIVPAFRSGDFYRGFMEVMLQVAGKFNIDVRTTQGRFVRKRVPARPGKLNAVLPLLMMVLVFGHLLLRKRRVARGLFSGAGMAGVGFFMIPGIGLGVLFLFFLGFIFGLAGVSNILYAMAASRGGYRGGFGGGFGGGGWGGGGGGFSGGGSSGSW